MIQKIHLSDVLLMIDESIEGETPKPFSIGFALYDEKKKSTTGRKIELPNAAKYHGERGVLRPVKKKSRPKSGDDKDRVKNPQHYLHQTRNIVDLDDETKHPIKVHIRLIYMFNGNYVYW